MIDVTQSHHVVREFYLVEVYTIEHDSEGTHLYKTVIDDAVEFDWYDDNEFFLVYTPVSQAFFDRDDLYSITVDGVEIVIPIT